MRALDCLSTPSGLRRLLHELASPVPDAELLADDRLWSHPAVREFARVGWGHEHVPRDACGPEGFVVLTGYQTRLLVERSRGGYKPYVLGGALLLLGYLVWPAYEVWIGGSRPLVGQRSLRSTLPWLAADGCLAAALSELGVTDSQAPGLRLPPNGSGLHLTTQHKWLNRAVASLHAELVEQMGLVPAPVAREDSPG